jgi:hypothetical protein
MNDAGFPMSYFLVPKLADIPIGVFEKILGVQGKAALC